MTVTRTGSVTVVVVALLCIFAAPAPGAAKPKPKPAPVKVVDTFRFNPPDGACWIEKEKSKMVAVFAEKSRRTEDHQSETRVDVRRISDGFTMSYRPLRIVILDNGSEPKPGDAKYFARVLLQDMVFCLNLDTTGTAKSVSGSEVTVAKLKEDLQLDTPATAAMRQRVDEMMEMLKDAHNEDLQGLVGKSTRTGKSWTAQTDVGVPFTGTTRLTVKTQIVGTAMAGTVPCVQVRSSYTADPQEFRDYFDTMVSPDLRTVLKALGTSATLKSATLSGTNDRLIDPATLLTYRATSKETMTLHYSVPEVGLVKVLVNEWGEQTFDHLR